MGHGSKLSHEPMFFFAALHEMLVASESWKAMDGCLRSMVIPHD